MTDDHPILGVFWRLATPNAPSLRTIETIFGSSFRDTNAPTRKYYIAQGEFGSPPTIVTCGVAILPTGATRIEMKFDPPLPDRFWSDA